MIYGRQTDRKKEVDIHNSNELLRIGVSNADIVETLSERDKQDPEQLNEG